MFRGSWLLLSLLGVLRCAFALTISASSGIPPPKQASSSSGNSSNTLDQGFNPNVSKDLLASFPETSTQLENVALITHTHMYVVRELWESVAQRPRLMHSGFYVDRKQYNSRIQLELLPGKRFSAEEFAWSILLTLRRSFLRLPAGSQPNLPVFPSSITRKSTMEQLATISCRSGATHAGELDSNTTLEATSLSARQLGARPLNSSRLVSDPLIDGPTLTPLRVEITHADGILPISVNAFLVQQWIIERVLLGDWRLHLALSYPRGSTLQTCFRIWGRVYLLSARILLDTQGNRYFTLGDLEQAARSLLLKGEVLASPRAYVARVFFADPQQQVRAQDPWLRISVGPHGNVDGCKLSDEQAGNDTNSLTL